MTFFMVISGALFAQGILNFCHYQKGVKHDQFSLGGQASVHGIGERCSAGGALAQANLENPAPVSFQSGISTVSGRIGEANKVEIVFDNQLTLRAAYDTRRTEHRRLERKARP